jgi:CubicO group peptidase (beta-lactamase class C family)
MSSSRAATDTLFRDPNTPQTKFFIGSITKQFTAAAILLLQERGQLNLDDPVSRFLPDYPSDPGHRITIRQLLTHTSGLPNYTDFPELILNRTIEIAPADIVASFKDLPLEFEPGTRFKYSNSGYILLGEIIEAVSGQSYEAFLHKELLKPLGMLNSGYGRREMGHPNRAEGYTIDSEGRLVGAVPIHFSILHSAGALYTTAEDMLKWDAGLRDGRILSPASVAQMMSTQAASYGFGWWVEARYGRTHAFHDGFLDGFNCTSDRWTDDDLSVLVFSNEDDAPVQKISRGLAAIAFGRRPVIPVEKTAIVLAPEELTAYEGVFRSDDGAERFVVVEEDTLHTFLTDQNPQHVFAEAPDHFFFAGDNSETLDFRRDEHGMIIELDYSDGEDRWRFRHTDQATPHLPSGSHESHGSSASTLGDYLGEYALDVDSISSDAAPRITVALCEDHLCSVVDGNNPVVLLGRDNDRFYQPVSGFVIEFVRDSANVISGCVIELDGERVIGRRISFPER